MVFSYTPKSDKFDQSLVILVAVNDIDPEDLLNTKVLLPGVDYKYT